MKLTDDQRYTFPHYLTYLKLNNGSHTVIELLELMLDESKSVEKFQEELPRLTLLINHPLDTLDSQKADARWLLGLCNDHGIGMPQNVGVAVTFYRAAADQGQVLAQNVLGYIYYGSKVKYWIFQNPVLAWQYFQQAAAQNNYVSAIFNQAVCYERGHLVPKDYRRERELFRQAALLFQKQQRELTLLGQEKLGAGWSPDVLPTIERNVLLVDSGYGGDPEFIKMKDEYRYKAKYLKESRDTSKGIDPKDKKHEAENLRQKATEGDVKALYQLGHCYEYGLGVTEDMNRSVLLYQKAAEQQYDAAISKLELINLLKTEKEDYYFPALKEAYNYYQNTLKNDKNGYACSTLGFCHQLGLGTSLDLQKTCEFYLKAIDKGMSCHWDLFTCYRSFHKPGDETKNIMELYQNLEHYTFNNSESYLCLAYLNEIGGPGIEKDFDKAEEFYKKVLDFIDNYYTSPLPSFQTLSEKKWVMEVESVIELPEECDIEYQYAKKKVGLFFSPFRALKKEIQESLDASNVSFPPRILSICAEYAFEYDLNLTKTDQSSKKTWRNLWGLI